MNALVELNELSDEEEINEIMQVRQIKAFDELFMQHGIEET